MMDDNRAISMLHSLAMHSVGAEELETVLNEVCDVAIAISKADFGNVQLMDPVTSDLRIAAQRGFSPRWVDFWNAEATARGVCGSAVESRERIVVEDVTTSPLFADRRLLGIQLEAGVRAVQSTPLLTRSGRPVGVLSTHFRHPHRPDARVLRWLDLLARQAADLIENAQTSSAQQTSEARLQALLKASSDVVYTLSPDWSRISVLKSNGPVVDSVAVAQGWFERYIDPNDQPRVMQALEQAARTKAAIDLEHRVQCPDDTVAWVHSRAVPVLDADGCIVEWFGATSDVTAARQASAQLFDERQRLEALLEALPVGVAFTDSPGCEHVRGNRALFELFEADANDNISASAVSATDYGRQIVYSCDGHPLGKDDLPLQRAAREGRTIGPVEISVQLPSGKAFSLELRGAPIRDADGAVIGAVTVSTDITERQQALQVREQARLKDEFLAVLSHELRNPLAAISTAVDLLNSDVTATQRRLTDQIIKNQVVVLKRLVNDLMDVSQMRLGSLRIQKATMSLVELLRTAAEAARPLAAARSLTLTVGLPERDVRFSGDNVRLLQVLGNLLDNAVKYSPFEGTIHLSGEVDGADIVLRCRDSGRGIPADMQAHIFEPLVRLESARRDAPGGLGLGLALVQHLVQLHGGSVGIHSEEGMGSEFIVRIPVGLPAVDTRPARSSPGAAVASPPCSVALVEDTPDVAQILALAMEGAGHRVTQYADGESALAGIPGLAPDVVVLDAKLPGMDGGALLAKLRRRAPLRHTLFIGISGSARGAGFGGESARFDHFLAKPFEIKDLLGLLRRKAAPAGRLRALLVDDHADLSAATAELLHKEGLEVACAPSGHAALEMAMALRPQILLCDMALPDMDGLALVDRLKHHLAAWGTYVAIVTARSEAELRPYNARAGKLGVDQFAAKPITAEWVRAIVTDWSIRQERNAGHASARGSQALSS